MSWFYHTVIERFFFDGSTASLAQRAIGSAVPGHSPAAFLRPPVIFLSCR